MLGTERPTLYYNGHGGAGESNWDDGSFWETWDYRKGDVARSILYMDIRYEGGIHFPTGTQEPDLIATNDPDLIQTTSSSPAYMGLLDALIQWHLDDPADDCERRRNHEVYGYQENRNPFVDNPEWVCILWADELPCSGASTPTPGPTSPPTSTPTPGSVTGEIWINEIHYDNAGTDTGEGIEIAGPSEMPVTGWSLVTYNGSTQYLYDFIPLSGNIPDLQECLGTLWFDVPGLQNGAPDGVALVDPAGSVIQFLSYEGSFTAADGPAAGMTSNDIGVSETNSTPEGYSLQLGGTGMEYTDFIWQPQMTHTRDAVNTNQTFSGGCATPTPGDTPTPVCINDGDVDNSGVLTAGDAQAAFAIALGLMTPTAEEACAADCDGNEVVTAGDAQAIFGAALGIGTCSDPII